MAASQRIKGITIEIGGDTSKLTKALSSVDRALSTTQNNLRDINRALKLDPSNTALLKDKQEELSRAVADTSKKLETEKEAYEQLAKADQTPENTEKMRQLQTQIDLDTVALKDLEKQAASAANILGEKMKIAGEKVKAVGDKISSVGKNLTMSVTAPIVAAGAAAVKMASDYEESINKVDVAFRDSSDTVKEWAKTATESFGLSQNAALEAASLFGDMGTSMGLTTKDAAEMSTSLAGLAGDLASFKNVDIEQAMTALKGVFTGETESLKNLGVVMTQVNLEEFAQRMGKSYKEMSEAEKVTLRYQYVLEKTANAQGDYLRTSDGTANSLRTLQASLENLAVTFGQEILPYITPIVQKVTELINKFSQLDDRTKKIIVTIAAIAAVVGPVLVVIGSVVSAIGTIMTVIGPLVAGIKTVTTAVGALNAFLLANPIFLIIAGIVALIAAIVYLWNNCEDFRNAVINIFNTVKEAFIAFGNKVKEIVDNVVEFVVNLYNKIKEFFTKIKDTIVGIWNGIKNFFKTTTDNIKQNVTDSFNKIKDSVVNTVNNIGQNTTTGVNRVKSAFSNGFNNIRNIVSVVSSNIRQYWSETMNNLRDSARNAVSNAASIFSSLKDRVGGVFSTLFGNMRTWGQDLINNFIEGIKDKIEEIKKTMKDVAATIKSYLHFSEPDEGPLSNFHTYAPDMMKLFAQGILDNAYLVTNAMTKSFALPAMSTMTEGRTQQTQTQTMTSSLQPINVNIALEGDANRLFRIVNAQAEKNRQVTGQVFNY